MPTLVRLGKLLIQIYADDYNPPHFHVVTPDTEALVRIAGFSIIAGQISRRDYETAIAWANSNLAVLEAEWRRLNER